MPAVPEKRKLRPGSCSEYVRQPFYLIIFFVFFLPLDLPSCCYYTTTDSHSPFLYSWCLLVLLHSPLGGGLPLYFPPLRRVCNNECEQSLWNGSRRDRRCDTLSQITFYGSATAQRQAIPLDVYIYGLPHSRALPLLLLLLFLLLLPGRLTRPRKPVHKASF